MKAERMKNITELLGIMYRIDLKSCLIQPLADYLFNREKADEADKADNRQAALKARVQMERLAVILV